MAEAIGASTIRSATAALSRTAENARRRVDEQKVMAFVAEYPLTSFFAALAAGYLTARLASRL
jgi:hypothetical protein